MTSDVQDSYDRVAKEYVQHIYNELKNKPFDRKMLDWLIEKVNNAETICDMGCGPGHIAHYLHEHGADTCGVDLSPGMLEQARLLNPDIPFQQGNMLALTDIPNEAFAGIAAFYSIVHIPRVQVVQALKEFKRILAPNGVLLMAFHLGNEILHRDEWWSEKVSIDLIFFEREEMKGYLQTAGFALDEVIERDPYPEVEFASRRAYIFTHRPS